nr:MAG TPA: hypothetical protein [Caudoviricetes sp.]
MYILHNIYFNKLKYTIYYTEKFDNKRALLFTFFTVS